jgi:hypothetical protein
MTAVKVDDTENGSRDAPASKLVEALLTQRPAGPSKVGCLHAKKGAVYTAPFVVR